MQEPPQAPQQVVYTQQHDTRFHERAKRLSLAALEGAHISTGPKRRDVVCWGISVPKKSAETRAEYRLPEIFFAGYSRAATWW